MQNGICRDVADVFKCDQLLEGERGDRLHAAERRKIARGDSADALDPDGVQKPLEGQAAACVDRRKQVADLLFLESVQSFEALRGEGVQVGKPPHAPLFIENGERRFGHALHVRRVFGTVVGEFLHDAGRAFAVGTEQVRPHFRNGRAARRTDERLFDGYAPLRMGNGAQNFGNDLIGAAHEHAGTHLYVLARQIAVIVERCAAHRRARKLDGRDEGERRQLARAPHLPDHPFNGRFRFLRFKFVGDRPAREFVGVPHPAANILGVRLDDGAVREHVQRFSAHFDLVHGSAHLFERRTDAQEREGLKAPLPEQRDRLLLRGDRLVAHIIDVVEDDLGTAGRRDLGIEIADRPRRGVARVLERLVGMRAVIFFEHGQADDRLPPHFQRPAIGNGERETAHGERLRRDVLPLSAVSARGRAHKPPFRIGQTHGQPVELILHGKLCRGIDLLHARDERRKLVLRDRLIQRKEGRDMRMARKRLDGLAAHAARRRIGQTHARLPLQLLQLVVERVILPVRHAGRILHIIFVRPLVERIHQITHSVHKSLRATNNM